MLIIDVYAPHALDYKSVQRELKLLEKRGFVSVSLEKRKGRVDVMAAWPSGVVEGFSIPLDEADRIQPDNSKVVVLPTTRTPVDESQRLRAWRQRATERLKAAAHFVREHY